MSKAKRPALGDVLTIVAKAGRPTWGDIRESEGIWHEYSQEPTDEAGRFIGLTTAAKDTDAGSESALTRAKQTTPWNRA